MKEFRFKINLKQDQKKREAFLFTIGYWPKNPKLQKLNIRVCAKTLKEAKRKVFDMWPGAKIISNG
ncbi:MAG: hypothetical protein PHW15_03330 [Patescibacteria group bacterium]|nr:hypothetical protein [Patescibacteria group bacterium]MDD5589540.1 hypothetical protein [Candidatus Nanoarchaeia archaeon]